MGPTGHGVMYTIMMRRAVVRQARKKTESECNFHEKNFLTLGKVHQHNQCISETIDYKSTLSREHNFSSYKSLCEILCLAI